MEKIKRHHATLMLLLVFIGAFLSQTFSAFGASAHNSFAPNHHAKYIHSSLEVVNSFSNDLFENETEDDTNLVDFVIPKDVFNFQFQSSSVSIFNYSAIVEECLNPIYILVCNFRI